MKKDRELIIAKQTLPLIKQYALQNIKGPINNLETKIKEQRINNGIKSIENLINNYEELYQLIDSLDEALNLATQDICKITEQSNHHWLSIKENYINKAKEETNDN